MFTCISRITRRSFAPSYDRAPKSGMVRLAPRFIRERIYSVQGLIASSPLSSCWCDQGRTRNRSIEGEEGREGAEAKQVWTSRPIMESVNIRLCSLPASDASIVPRSYFGSSCSLRKAGLSGSAGRFLSWNGNYITLRFNAGDNKFVREHCNPSSHILGALHTQAEAAAVSTIEEVDELADVDWDDLGFGIKQTDYMYIMKCGKDGIFFEGDLTPFGTIELSPSAGVLNYGQGLFEGLKAYRRADGRIVLFRPEENALRMINGAERMCMPAPSAKQFVEAVKQTVLANKRWIPPFGKGSLYIRPLLMGSGPVLGLAPAPEVTFLIYVSPVGNYFKEGLAPIHLKVETEHHRATPGGTGGVKTIGNYAPVLSVQSRAKANGFSDVVYLDAINKKYLEEVSSCNIFVVKDNVISTPALHGTILPGITRKSIIEVARNRGYEVQERLISVDELLDANEVFCTGTAVVVSPVGSITYFDKSVAYKNGVSGGVSRELYSALTGIQMGLSEDSMEWTMELN